MSLVRSPSPQLRRNTSLQSTGEGAGIVTVVIFYVIEVNIIIRTVVRISIGMDRMLAHMNIGLNVILPIISEITHTDFSYTFNCNTDLQRVQLQTLRGN